MWMAMRLKDYNLSEHTQHKRLFFHLNIYKITSDSWIITSKSWILLPWTQWTKWIGTLISGHMCYNLKFWRHVFGKAESNSQCILIFFYVTRHFNGCNVLGMEIHGRRLSFGVNFNYSELLNRKRIAINRQMGVLNWFFLPLVQEIFGVRSDTPNVNE